MTAPAAPPVPDTDHDWRTVTLLGVLVGSIGLLAVGSATVVDVSPAVESIVLAGVGGALTALVWYTFGTAYAIAVGHVVLLALFPDGIDRTAFVLAEAVFLTMLLVAATRTPRPRRFGAVALAGTVGLGGTVWLALETQPLWVATIALFAVLGLAGYGLHRYELVRLGLVSESVDSPDAVGGTDERASTDTNATGRIQL